MDKGEFQKTVGAYLDQGYRKIGLVSVQSRYFVDPYEVRKLAADKGANLVVGCWFMPTERRSKSSVVEFRYQLLDKSVPAAPSAVPTGLGLRQAFGHRPGSY